MKVKKVKISMVRLQLVREAMPKYDVIVRTPQDVHRLVWELIGSEDREHFIVLMLDTKNHINAMQTVSIGTLNAGLVHPREVFKAIFLANSASVIFAHNHPSGNPEPSPEDKAITERLVDCATLFGIEVLDHIIVGTAERMCSLKEMGCM